MTLFITVEIDNITKIHAIFTSYSSFSKYTSHINICSQSKVRSFFQISFQY